MLPTSYKLLQPRMLRVLFALLGASSVRLLVPVVHWRPASLLQLLLAGSRVCVVMANYHIILIEGRPH